MTKCFWLTASLLLATTLAGCGGASAPTYAPSVYGGYAAMATAPTGQPMAASAPQAAPNAYDQNANGAPATEPASSRQLTALLSHVKNGEMFGLGDFVATVLVSNPSDVTLAGTLTVTFMDSGQPTSDVQTMDLSLAAGQSQSFTFTDTTWSTDNATIQIVTQAPTPGSGGMTSLGF